MTPLSQTRLTARFAACREQKRAAFISYISAYDPDKDHFMGILNGLPDAGVDILEIGMPFSDPMADGPTIQEANLRAFRAGVQMPKILDAVRAFRAHNDTTPIILMGYYNPIFAYGVDRFVKDAHAAGVDGLIVADLPPEEDVELCDPALRAGVHFIRLLTPTTDSARLPAVLKNASGFLYYVSVAGITGTQKPDATAVESAVRHLKQHTDIPLAVGFGIETADQVRAIAGFADGVIVGSAIVKRIAQNLDADGKAKPGLVADVLGFVKTLTQGVYS